MKLFSDVMAAGLIQRKKRLYTMTDLNRIIVDSLFTAGRTLTPFEARWVLLCSAAHHNADVSAAVRKIRNTTKP